MTEEMIIDMDFHIHTYHSPCARKDMTPQGIVKVAKKCDTGEALKKYLL